MQQTFPRCEAPLGIQFDSIDTPTGMIDVSDAQAYQRERVDVEVAMNFPPHSPRSLRLAIALPHSADVLQRMMNYLAFPCLSKLHLALFAPHNTPRVRVLGKSQ